ncbi:uncharacterized protein BDR25DRAFT_352000 [Lindgomyces ingoldianus]|uniref:Uncharacterized protein n=1 Tax=Lindgomyces ingoldianus TaxID=673940 RepID=A0ACB6R5B6_9PLEO|nr:uncharacterized protein BDR25DRAFT_352000 [Lindgomyces ingoldianus]KAF2474449.1 hypothetical protein BDR25DRAFT_352000 [Lindgomyces ingoldianus]
MEDTYIESCRQRVCALVTPVRNLVDEHDDLVIRALLSLELGREIFNGNLKDESWSDGDELEEQKSTLELEGLLQVPREEHIWERSVRIYDSQLILMAGSELRADIEPYAKAICLKLAAAFYVTLPREIRDLVYSYLTNSGNNTDHVIIVCDGKPSFRNRSYCGRADTRTSKDSFWDISVLEYYLNSEYMGLAVAREIAEAYYQTNTFYFDYHDLPLLHKFLTLDRFGYGLVPAGLVRYLDIVLDGDYGCPCNSRALCHCDVTQNATITPDKAIRLILEQLLMVKTRQISLRITVYIMDGLMKVKEFVGILHIVFPIICRLKEHGFRVTLRSYTNRSREWTVKDSSEHPIDQVLGAIREKFIDILDSSLSSTHYLLANEFDTHFSS